MNGTRTSLAEVDRLIAACPDPGCDVLICPPATLISPLVHKAEGAIAVGGQDCHWLTSGAHTGDISAEMLADAAAVFGGDRPAVVARELTKLFETVLDGPLDALAARVATEADQRKGEFVVLIEGAGEDADARLAEGRRVYALLAAELKPSQAAKLAAEITGAPRKALYGRTSAGDDRGDGQA